MLRFQSAVCLLIGVMAANPGLAAVKKWNAGSGNWSDASAWNPLGVPATGDAAEIAFNDGVARTISYDFAGPPVTLNYFALELTGPGTDAITFNMPAGQLTSDIGMFVGPSGRAVTNQSGGTTTLIQNGLSIGANAGGDGIYNLSGNGALVANVGEAIGQNGIGTFNQTGGTNTIPGAGHHLRLATNAGTGNYFLDGGILSVGDSEYVGDVGTGSFNQSGGVNNVAGTVYVANAAGSVGNYVLGGSGQLTTNALVVATDGTGTFAQSGGVQTSSTLQLGTGTSSNGNYSLSGGAANVGNIYVGGSNTAAGGAGVMSVSGSNTVLNVSGTINIYNGGSNAFDFSSGTVNTSAINVNGAPSRFNWTGGTLNITNDLAFGGGMATSTGAAFSSSLGLGPFKHLKVAGNETIGGNGVFNLNVGSGIHAVTGSITLKPGGTISQSTTGTISSASFIQAGGTISTYFRNIGNYTYQSGMVNATFVNSGNFTMGPTMTIVGQLQNDGMLSVAGGQTLTVTTSITNTGSFRVDGGTIFASTFTNGVGGTLTARGTFNPQITNPGTLVVDGPLNAAVTNTGVVQGAGTITSFSNTFGNSAGGVVNSNVPGGALAFAFSFANSAGATVNVGPTSTFAPSQGWMNSGIVNLQGAGSRISGGTMTNNGIVQGFGMIVPMLATSNSGVFRASGGDLVFANPFLNSSQSTVQVLAGSSATFLQGMTTNSGQVSIVGGTFDNTGRTLSNQGTINGYGTLRTGGLTNNATRLISIGEGNMDVFGNVTNNGVISIQSGRNAYFWNNVSGSGSFTGTGTAVFLATLSPGSSPASVNFAGGVDLGGGTSLAMELGGTTAGTQYDQVHVAGQLSLGGILSLSLINGFAPSAGNAFDLLDWGTLAGTFSSIALPSLGSSLVWDTSQLYTSGVVSVVSALPGDYNGNGTVDAADYVLWRKGGPLANEVHAPGTVNAADYDAWRERFGNTSGVGVGAGAVPETTSAGLIVIGMLAVGVGKRRR